MITTRLRSQVGVLGAGSIELQADPSRPGGSIESWSTRGWALFFKPRACNFPHGQIHRMVEKQKGVNCTTQKTRANTQAHVNHFTQKTFQRSPPGFRHPCAAPYKGAKTPRKVRFVRPLAGVLSNKIKRGQLHVGRVFC
jgi:hypothetical protein